MKAGDVQIIAQAIGAATKPLRDRIESLETQVKAMPVGLNYRGPFRDGDEYNKNDIVTFQGSMWFCRAATGARPNDSQSSAWQLAVKKGRDAR